MNRAQADVSRLISNAECEMWNGEIKNVRLVTLAATKQGRTTKPRPARHSGLLSGNAQTSRRRLAVTRQALLEIAQPFLTGNNAS
jgi:hypothetical protein